MEKHTLLEQALSVYIPTDRRHTMAQAVQLAEQASGAAMFADISGFTPLTEALARALGPRRGAEELTRQLNLVYDALIAQVHRFRGSVIGFAGDAITCWFDETDPLGFPQPKGSCSAPLRAVACALACQRTMGQFAQVAIPGGDTVQLAVKASVASGPARRFLVGDPTIQLIDVLAGATLARMAAGEHLANKGEVIVDARTAALLKERIEANALRSAPDRRVCGEEERFFVVKELAEKVEPSPWPELEAGALSEEQVRPWLLPPIYTRLREGLGEFVTELRPVVALFLHFEGIDYDEDEDAGAKLDAYIRWTQATLAPYEGSLLQFIVGDKGNYLYATFGAPLAHENDAARAASAALELRSPPEELAFIHTVQIGLSQGTMRTGAYGGTQRRTYGVLGDDVNLAARLMQAAAPGEVLTSSHVQRAIAADFNWEALPAIQVKGKAQPIPVARLAGKQPARETIGALFRHYSGAPVGRETELARLEPVLDQALGGEGQIVRLEGSTGVGKSHLAAEFARRAARRGLRVCLGTCQVASQNVSYTAWQQIFCSLLGLAEETREEEDIAVANARNVARVQAALERLNPAWSIRLPLLGDLLDLPIPDNATTAAFEPRLRQEALFALAVELVQAYARQRPLLLLVEDAHWMDEASQGLTLALGRVVASSPALLMLVHRPPLHEDKPILPELERLPNHHHLDLSELSPEGIAALVTNRLGSGGEWVSPLALSLLQARAQGNPFFAEELVDALREAEHLVYLPPQTEGGQSTWALSDALVSALREANCLQRDPASGEWGLCPEAQLSAAAIDIPGSVHGAVLSRLDRLPELHKLTLKVASVIGRTFELNVLAGANPAKPGRKALQIQLEVFEKRDFTRLELPPPHAAYIFKHNITQEVAYGTLLGAQQRELHRAVGEVLETLQPDAAEPLAHHFSRGNVSYKAQFYLDRAAHKAQREHANETALSYYAQALALEERWEWRKGQIEVLHILGRRVEELTALRALEALPDAPAGTVAELWGAYYEAVGDYPQAQAAVERALNAAREQANRVGEVSSLAQLGLIARRQGDYERAKSWYQQALNLFQAGEDYSAEEAAVFASALNGLGIVHRQQGNFDEAKACYEQALALSRGSGNRKGEAETLNSLGVTARYQCNFTEALVYQQQALEIQQAIGDRAGEGISLLGLAHVNVYIGDYHHAEKFFQSALAIQQVIGNRWEEVNIWNGLGVLYQELGNLIQAELCLQNGLRLSQEIGDESGQAYMLSILGLVARDRGDLKSAENLLSEGLALAQNQDDKNLIAFFLSYMGNVSLLAEKLDDAIKQANAALVVHKELGLHLLTADDLATLTVAYLHLPDKEKALTCARQLLAILGECGGEGPEFPHRDYFACYQVLQANRQNETARNALQSAYQLVMARADKITDPDLRRSFLENVPINRQIVEECGRVVGESGGRIVMRSGRGKR